MRESVTYQEILEEGRAEGRAEGIRRILLRRGRKRFGAPDKKTRSALDAIQDIERLEELVDRVEEVNGWQELLA